MKHSIYDKRNIPKKYKDGIKVRLFLYDEAPLIGCGYRMIIANVKRKWAYLYYPPTRTSKRLTIKDYGRILNGTEKRSNTNE
jgi:hypothetical protein